MLKKNIEDGNMLVLNKLEGKTNPFYNWINQQKVKFRNGSLSEEEIDKFNRIGIDLGNYLTNSQKDGFTKWANKLKEIHEFIIINGHFPKSCDDKVETNLYASLNRTKQSLFKKQLSEKQLKFIKDFKIELFNQ